MKLTILRPELNEIGLSKIKTYLLDKWDRAKRARSEQLESQYTAWQNIYDGKPLEKVRMVPFYKSSNFVVKLVRM